MSSVKTLIVEDELIIANDLRQILETKGYEVCHIARTYESALAGLKQHQPDIVLLDILIKGDNDGIAFASLLRSDYNIPFIYISSHTDSGTLQRAKATNPYGFLVKPFEDEDVWVAIEMALSNFAKEQASTNVSEENLHFIINKSLFIRQKNLAIKVGYDDIVYVRADANYCTLYTRDQHYVLRATLKELEGRLMGPQFYRAHRSYIINLNHLTAINSDAIYLGNEKLPVGRDQHIWLMNNINKL